jgi:glutamine synthetase
MTAALSPEQAQAFLSQHPDVAWVDLLLFDANGMARGKRVRAADLPAFAAKGMLLPLSVYGTDTVGTCVDETGLLWETGDPDHPCIILADTLAAEPGTDMAHAVLVMPAAEHLDPRAVLQRQVDRLAAHGLTAVVAVELEFYLSEPLDEANPRPRTPARCGGAADRPQLLVLDDIDAVKPVIDAIYAAAEAARLPVDCLLAEAGPGQFEINLKHKPDAVGAAQDGALLKRVIKRAARQHGLDATFMAKPHEDWPGSGCHVHVSLVDASGTNVFANPQSGGAPWSARMQQALGGLMAGLGEGMALWAPTGNAWRRYVPKAYVAHTAQWGRNNRTVSLRIPHGTGPAMRVEHRIAGADANPFLVVAGILAGMLHGIEQQLDPGPEVSGDGAAQAARTLPTEWGAALAALDQSVLYRTAFGDAFVNNYLAIKRSERTRFTRQVSEIDHRWYARLV